jgi:hypothetical protein
VAKPVERLALRHAWPGALRSEPPIELPRVDDCADLGCKDEAVLAGAKVIALPVVVIVL